MLKQLMLKNMKLCKTVKNFPKLLINGKFYDKILYVNR